MRSGEGNGPELVTILPTAVVGPVLGDSVSGTSHLLRSSLGDAARKVPRRRIPSFVIRLAGRFVPDMRNVVPDLGHVKRISTAREREILGPTPRSWQTAVLDGTRSMIDRGLVP